MKKILLFWLCISLSGCILYRQDVQQGNIVTQEALSQLYPGMSAQQVRYILGNPVLSHSFDVNRWDYIYTFRTGACPTEVKRLTLYFENDQLVRISPISRYQIAR